jgi:P27 family predicted phage terminase small subunit
MRGAKPKPAELKILEGNPGKRPIDPDRPQPTRGLPPCPTHLKGEARREWRRLGSRLEAVGLVTNVDTAAFAAYCQAWSRWVDAEKNLAREGTIIKAPSGYPIPNPWLAVANKAMEQMKAFLVEFGMTPSSRNRVATAPIPDAGNPADEFFEKPLGIAK